jgi:hypothetical protein
MFPKLAKDIKKSNHILICKVFADGAYESNVVFKCLVDNGMLPCILTKKKILKSGTPITLLEIYRLCLAKNDLQRWKNCISDGKRRIAK